VKIVTFRDLRVWQEAMDLALSCYRLTARFPKCEQFGGLATQARRAATSILSNIAEGKVRPTNVFRNHISVALGSHAELDTQLELAMGLEYVSPRSCAPRWNN
jgi:four helix bundle protein